MVSNYFFYNVTCGGLVCNESLYSPLVLVNGIRRGFYRCVNGNGEGELLFVSVVKWTVFISYRRRITFDLLVFVGYVFSDEGIKCY